MAFQYTTARQEDARRYMEDRAKRVLGCLNFSTEILGVRDQFLKEVYEIQRDGILIWRDFFSRKKIEALGEEIDRMVRDKKCLTSIRNHSAETQDDLAQGRYRYFDPAVVAEKNFLVRDKVSWAGVKDPLINLNGLVDLAFDTRLINLATAYHQAIPLLTFVKVRKSFANDLPAADTQLFHVDGGSYRIFKALIYLNETGEGGGPFCYVRGSHLKKFDGWEKNPRYVEQEMAQRYGQEAILRCYAKPGDVVFAETTGFHQGEKPIKYDRGILILNYCVQPEYGYDYEKNKIQKATLEKQPELSRLVAGDLVPC